MPFTLLDVKKDSAESNDKLRLFEFIEKSRIAVLEKVGKVITTDKNKALINALASLLLQFEIIKLSQHSNAIIKNIKMGQQYLITVYSMLDKSDHCGMDEEQLAELLKELPIIRDGLLAFLNSEQAKSDAQAEPHSALEDSAIITPIKKGGYSSASASPAEDMSGSDEEEELAGVVTPPRL